jgi:hypothetical protein
LKPPAADRTVLHAANHVARDVHGRRRRRRAPSRIAHGVRRIASCAAIPARNGNDVIFERR